MSFSWGNLLGILQLRFKTILIFVPTNNFELKIICHSHICLIFFNFNESAIKGSARAYLWPKLIFESEVKLARHPFRAASSATCKGHLGVPSCLGWLYKFISFHVTEKNKFKKWIHMRAQEREDLWGANSSGDSVFNLTFWEWESLY